MSENIGTNLRYMRKHSKLTQAELAQALGITRSQYSNYEGGTREVPLTVVEKAATYFGCDMELLFDDMERVGNSTNPLMFVSAFRVKAQTPQDGEAMMRFKEYAKAYIMLDRLEADAAK